MKGRVQFRREVRLQPSGPLGCLLGVLGLAGLVLFVIFVAIPLLTVAIGIGIGLVLAGGVVYAYFRVKWAIRRYLRRRRGEEGYSVQVLDEPDDDEPPRRPQFHTKVEVRRRPPRR